MPLLYWFPTVLVIYFISLFNIIYIYITGMKKLFCAHFDFKSCFLKQNLFFTKAITVRKQFFETFSKLVYLQKTILKLFKV